MATLRPVRVHIFGWRGRGHGHVHPRPRVIPATARPKPSQPPQWSSAAPTARFDSLAYLLDPVTALTCTRLCSCAERSCFKAQKAWERRHWRRKQRLRWQRLAALAVAWCSWSWQGRTEGTTRDGCCTLSSQPFV
jgi:hypothetical protein